jgi:hypothetical protein
MFIIIMHVLPIICNFDTFYISIFIFQNIFNILVIDLNDAITLNIVLITFIVNLHS